MYEQWHHGSLMPPFWLQTTLCSLHSALFDRVLWWWLKCFQLTPQRPAPPLLFDIWQRERLFIYGLFIICLILRSNVTTTMAPNWHQCLSFCSPAGEGLDNTHLISRENAENSSSVRVNLFLALKVSLLICFFLSGKIRKEMSLLLLQQFSVLLFKPNYYFFSLVSKAVWCVVFEQLPCQALACMSNGCNTQVAKEKEISDEFAQHEASAQTCHTTTAALISLAGIF